MSRYAYMMYFPSVFTAFLLSCSAAVLCQSPSLPHEKHVFILEWLCKTTLSHFIWLCETYPTSLRRRNSETIWKTICLTLVLNKMCLWASRVLFSASKYNSWVCAHSCQDHRREKPCGKTPCYNTLIEKKFVLLCELRLFLPLQLILHCIRLLIIGCSGRKSSLVKVEQCFRKMITYWH